MTSSTERKYLNVSDIQREYLPISKKKIRELVKEHLYVRKIGNRIYVEREALEALLSHGKSQRTTLDWERATMKKTKIRALLIEPMMPPVTYYIEPTMKAFRKAVNKGAAQNGKLEAKKLEQNIYAVFNKDRFLTNLAPNRRIGDDIIVGKMFIVAIDENRMPISMTDEQIANYALRFWNVEEFDDMDVMEANMNTFLFHFLKDE